MVIYYVKSTKFVDFFPLNIITFKMTPVPVVVPVKMTPVPVVLPVKVTPGGGGGLSLNNSTFYFNSF